MSDLDFSTLTDDQLIILIRSALADAVRRGAAAAIAAQGVYLDAAEQARVAVAAAEREAQRIRHEEAERIARDAAEQVRAAAAKQTAASRQKEEEEKAARIAARFAFEKATLTELKEILGDLAGEKSWWIEVWSKAGEKRVYLGTKGCKFGKNEIDYYHTGKLSRYDQKEPGTFETFQSIREHPEVLEAIKVLCVRLCEKYTATVIGSK